MKLSHVTMYYFPLQGGQDTYIHTLNQILCDSGIDVSVIQPSRSKNLSSPENVNYTRRLYLASKFNRLFNGVDWFWFNLMLLFKKKYLQKQDVLISHYPIHYPAISWHPNIIVVSHGLDWGEPPKLFFDKYKIKSALSALNNGVKIVANDTCFLRALGIDIKEGEQYFKEVSKNVWFIPNCIDINKFICKNYQRKNIVLVPRNIRKARGIHLAIEAFNLFYKNHNDFIMQIVGGPLQGRYYNYCRGLVKQYKLEKVIQFTGNIQNEELIEYYNKSKITLIPTVDFEGTSISALESMACKTPVVSTKVGGLLDLPTWKVDKTPISISEGMEHVLNNWEEYSINQYTITTNVFNTVNWGNAWLSAIRSSYTKFSRANR